MTARHSARLCLVLSLIVAVLTVLFRRHDEPVAEPVTNRGVETLTYPDAQGRLHVVFASDAMGARDAVNTDDGQPGEHCALK